MTILTKITYLYAVKPVAQFFKFSFIFQRPNVPDKNVEGILSEETLLGGKVVVWAGHVPHGKGNVLVITLWQNNITPDITASVIGQKTSRVSETKHRGSLMSHTYHFKVRMHCGLNFTGLLLKFENVSANSHLSWPMADYIVRAVQLSLDYIWLQNSHETWKTPHPIKTRWSYLTLRTGNAYINKVCSGHEFKLYLKQLLILTVCTYIDSITIL